MRVTAASIWSVQPPPIALAWWKRLAVCHLILCEEWPDDEATVRRVDRAGFEVVECNDSQGEELFAILNRDMGYAMGYCKESRLAQRGQRVVFPPHVTQRASANVRDLIGEQEERMCGFTWCAWYDVRQGKWMVPPELAEGEGAASDELEYMDIATGGWGPIAGRLFDDYCDRDVEVAQLLSVVVGDRPDWGELEELAGASRLDDLRRAVAGIWDR